MDNFLFYNEETGEYFFAQADTKREAWGVVIDNFGVNPDIQYIGKYSDDEAEDLGYDTY